MPDVLGTGTTETPPASPPRYHPACTPEGASRCRAVTGPPVRFY
ncbi:hypothetical protein Pd630_LPD05173 [Rhodococcus opacus PD630]|nr:hypothetical protein Pd630_LPD05173 [Rhodococcus opacus PD630]EJJ00887.1 hypothetical protein JVH1_1513 [Rhodococcus sp. JVH1]